MTTLWLDEETRSTLNLVSVGTHIYAKHCEITLNSWAIDGDAPQVDEGFTRDFLDAYRTADVIASHGDFDPIVLREKLPDLWRPRVWYNTMAQARRHGLPGGLAKLCTILKVPADQAKMTEAHEDMLLFCKPLKDGTWATKATHPDRWARFVKYGGLDVEAMRAVHARCPTWNDTFERDIEAADRAINDRGFAVDLDFCDKAIAILKTEGARLDAAAQAATDHDVHSARQRDALLVHICWRYGVHLPDLRASTLERRIKDDDLPDALRELLSLRLQSSRTSTSKYATARRRTGEDGRMRGTTVLCGAMRTKRWSGKDFQPHNQMRPEIGTLKGEALTDEVRWGIAATKAGVLTDMATQPVTSILASAIRGVIVPAPGYKLVVGDWKNVEGRGLAWAAGEESALKEFAEFDAGTGKDPYKVTFSNASGVPVDAVDDGKERQIGKILRLMLGYEGGVSAILTGALTYKVELTDIVGATRARIPPDVWAECERWYAVAVKKHQTYGLDKETFCTCDGLKRLHRRTMPKTVAMWGAMRDAAVTTIRTRRETRVGPFGFDMKGTWLRMLGPAGDFLSYPAAQVEPTDEGVSIRYYAENQYTKKWQWTTTYGGKLVENAIQWLCRNILARTLVACEEEGFDTVLHVHDEPIGEVAEEHAQAWAHWLKDTMERPIEWAPGLPLAAEVKVLDRYEKA